MMERVRQTKRAVTAARAPLAPLPEPEAKKYTVQPTDSPRDQRLISDFLIALRRHNANPGGAGLLRELRQRSRQMFKRGLLREKIEHAYLAPAEGAPAPLAQP